MSTPPPTRLRFGPFQVDLHTHELWKHGIRLKLSGQPFDILAILLATPGQLVTREQLRAQLWPSDTFVDFDHSLNAAINKLRDAISDSVDSPRYIETLPRRGYRFIATVEPVDDSSPAVVASDSVGSAFRGGPLTDMAGSVAELSATSGATSPLSSHPYLFAATIAILILLAATLLQKVSFTANRHDSFTSVQRIRPLTNLADETSEPAFSPGGSYIAFDRHGSSSESSGIFVQSASTGELVQLTRNPEDGFPAWSPDSRSIAFTREHNRDVSIYLIPFPPAHPNAESSERKLDTGSVLPIRRELAWSPEGKSLLFSAPSGLVLLSLQNSSATKLTEAPPNTQDWGATISPDAKRLLFVRSQYSGFHDEIFSMPISGGEPTLITSDHANVLGPPQWSPDSQSVLFSSDRGSHPGLWRVSVTTRDTPVQLNDTGAYPALSRVGNRLAYERITRNLHIWERDLTTPTRDPRILIASTSETDQGPGPQISPDGKKVAYMSDHSGAMEIWIADRDGSHPLQLTSLGNTGSPRWSPDSKSIAFDAGQRTGPAIYSVSVTGGPPRLLIASDNQNNVCPSFSRDGKWVYFASTRSGNFQLWKVPAEGGTPTQITHNGAHAPIASLDGKLIYYAKTQYANPEIWQVPVNGGPEKLVSPLLNPVTWAAWSVTERGIVFAHPSGHDRPAVGLFDPKTRHVTHLATLRIPPFWLTASPDARSILYDQPGWQQAQIMLVDNFR
ncbi:MAG TPA: winged helix-turn-helix domain-containing protein [Dongiaceae bacterium]|nr:winged helix-turn-helix domain-containing protein [Dongiaceae bacterium]